ncbi:pilus assembly protein PilM, partial [Patulibacter sp. S7RM1-6]
ATAADADGPLVPRAESTAVLPLGAVRANEVQDASAVARALRTATEGRDGFSPRVRLGIAGPKVAVRTLDLPPVQREEDVPAVVRAVARERIPTAADDALVDYVLLPQEEGSDGRRALVVAARRDLVEGHVVAARAAGLEPVGVDLVAFGVARAVPLDAPTLVLDLDCMTTLALAGPDGCRFVRTVSAGAESAADQIAGRTGHDTADAAAVLFCQRTLDEEDTAAREAVLVDTVRSIATAVRTTVDAHAPQGSTEAPTSCVVSGSLAGTEGVLEVLGDVLDLPVRLADADTGVVDAAALGLSVAGSV